MKIFHCDHCDQLVFFENTRCLSCGHVLAYLPDVADMGALVPGDDDKWKRAIAAIQPREYRLCDNYRLHDVCNWAIPADRGEGLCPSCRLTLLIPDPTEPTQRERWYKLEIAKRRLLATLLMLRLPITDRTEDSERGLGFEFLADSQGADAQPVLTGHRQGVITIALAEADDAERERRRIALGEPYRTLLGHFRHESGHYYWQRLVDGSDAVVGFRERFGDERRDYAASLREYHEQGASEDWRDHFVSAYAAAHPWEDWAETWAHYLHIAETLDTAAACGLRLEPRTRTEPTIGDIAAPVPSAFDAMMSSWFPLTYVLNNLNRSLGLADGYPFVLPPPAIEKLRFVHDVVAGLRP